ncbi:MAG TPA: SMI1/KNR4 family protein, partial [Vicinamibacteria bacterium]
ARDPHRPRGVSGTAQSPRRNGEAEPLEAALAALERDAAEHLTAGPAAADEVAQLEERLGLRLPPAFRRFLERLGGGLFYQQHEIFGARRVLIHDIELLPDLVTFCRRVEADGLRPAPGLLPFHRAGDVVHLLDLRDQGRASPAVRALDGSDSYPDFEAFLTSLAPARPV